MKRTNITPEELNYLRVHTCITYNSFKEGFSLNCEPREVAPADYIFLGDRIYTDRFSGKTDEYPTYMWEKEAEAWLEFLHKRSTDHNVAEDFKTLIETNLKYGVWDDKYRKMFMDDLTDVKKYRINYVDVEDYAKHPYEDGYYGNGWLRDSNPVYNLDTVVRGQLADMYNDEFITSWTWKEIA